MNTPDLELWVSSDPTAEPLWIPGQPRDEPMFLRLTEEVRDAEKCTIRQTWMPVRGDS